MQRKWVNRILFAILLSVTFSAAASPVRLKATDKTGAGFSNVLVIVKSLDGKGEIFRALTDAEGAVPERELGAGLYRVIATCPYGICETKVEEFYVKDAPVQLELTLDVLPTHGEGDVVEVGPSKPLKIQITDSEGQPARTASVLVRDADAEHERWYKADSQGAATVELPEGRVTVVVLYAGKLTSKNLSAATVDELRAKGAPLAIRVGVGQASSSSKAVAPQGMLLHEAGHAAPPKEQ